VELAEDHVSGHRAELVRDRCVAVVVRRLRTGRQFVAAEYFFFFFKQKTAYEIGLGIPAEPLFRSLPPSPTKSSNLSETAEVPACNVPSRSPLPALAIAPETKLGTASSGLGTLEP